MRMQGVCRIRKIFIGFLLLLGIQGNAVDAFAEDTIRFFSESGQSIVLPINDGSGKYLLKGEGFYCLNADGSADHTASVHYFDHFEIDGTVFHGYYYHDETGKIRAGEAMPVSLEKISVQRKKGHSIQTEEFDGIYMVNNLGKMDAAPQIRYLEQFKVGNTIYDGFFYFDETGRMNTEPEIYYLDMECEGQRFQGSYYFGENGALLQQSGMTEDGYYLDETGKVSSENTLGIKALKPALKEILAGYSGKWSIYIKDLKNNEELNVNNSTMYSASLIKAFVLEATYADMEQVLKNQAEKLKLEPTDPKVQEKVDTLLWNMITISDNESFNELVRLHSTKNDFCEGAEKINEYLKEQSYNNTLVQHTLSPSASKEEGIGERNITSAADCGMLLERIYNKKCVNEEVSEEMLELLLNQKVRTKIPAEIEENATIANKTGENTQDQHDIAIIYGEHTEYILCILSEDTAPTENAVKEIQLLSKIIYNYLEAE